jgi:cytochrome c5
MNHMNRMSLACLALAATAVVAQAKSAQEQSQPHPAPKTVQAVDQDRGEQVFNQNCARCHNAPEGFSPRISATVAKHMRVRANLSEADYKALVRFLNP